MSHLNETLFKQGKRTKERYDKEADKETRKKAAIEKFNKSDKTKIPRAELIATIEILSE